MMWKREQFATANLIGRSAHGKEEASAGGQLWHHICLSTPSATVYNSWDKQRMA